MFGPRKHVVTRLPSSVSAMAYGSGVPSPTSTAVSGLFRCVLANRSFGSLIIFFWMQGGVLSAIPQFNFKPNFVPIDVILLSRFVPIFFLKVRINYLHIKPTSRPARAVAKKQNVYFTNGVDLNDHDRKDHIGFFICNGGKIRVGCVRKWWRVG